MGSYKKKLFIVLLLTLFLGFFVCGSVNASSVYQDYDWYTTDSSQEFNKLQDIYAYMFLKKFDEVASNTYKIQLRDLFNRYNVYFYYYINNDVVRIRAIFYNSNVNWSSLDNNEVNSGRRIFYNDYVGIPTTGYNITADILNANNFSCVVNFTSGSTTIYQTDFGTAFIETVNIGYRPDIVNSYLNGVSPNSSPFAMIFSAIQENTEQQAETTEEMKKLNDFMSSEDIDQDAYDMPTTNPTQDTTQEGINNIFNKFYNKITQWNSENIMINIPFTNKYFIIPANLTENIISNIPSRGFAEILKRLLSLIWYYLLGVYVVKDVQKYIDGLKTGEILTKSDTNVKTEML